MAQPAAKQGREVPFSKVSSQGNERKYVEEVMQSGALGFGGRFCTACEDRLSAHFPDSTVLLTNSATSALEIAVLALGLAPGDEVIMPSYTFVSTANAVTRAGGLPRFVDVRPDTMNLDLDLVKQAIGPRTKAIMPVHYAAVGCAPAELQALADDHGIPVIEDAAHCFNASHAGRALGSFGAMAAISFDIQKNVSCGEGGMLVVNDAQFVDKAQVLREMGTNRRAFLAGKVSEYSWVGSGSRLGMPELSAAFLLGQLERGDAITRHRLMLWHAYRDRLAPLAARGDITLPVVPEGAGHNAHIAFFFTRSTDERARLIQHLKAHGVSASFHYVPLHASPFGRDLGNAPGDLPVTEDCSARLLRLPLFETMTLDQLDQVCEAMVAFYQTT